MRLVDPFDCDDGHRNSDVPKLQAALIVRGIWASKETVMEAWSRYSDSHAAGWLSPYDDDDKTISKYAVECLLRELEEMEGRGEEGDE